jgi:hypothetical protein
MPATTFHSRRAHAIENGHLRLTVLEGGGHIAEILHKKTGVSPLWIPPWPSIEPSAYQPGEHPEYGSGTEARLLAGIMGHSLCLDIFGGPSPEEADAGLTVHGESSVLPYDIAAEDGLLQMRATLPLAGLAIERTIQLRGESVRIREAVCNLCAFDRAIAWTQHVTLGPPFLEKGVTTFRASVTRSKTFETPFGAHDYLPPGVEFDWPIAARADGGSVDLKTFSNAPSSSAFTAHLIDPGLEDGCFVAYAPQFHLVFGYVWKRADFPWLGIWEENLSRSFPPWNGRAIARGMEFGVSPMPETRRQMIERGQLFGVPVYRWLPARGRCEVEYWASVRGADAIPEHLERPGE